MKAAGIWALAFVLAFAGLAKAQSQGKHDSGHASDRDRLIGAWHLVSMEEPGADGKMRHVVDRKGILIYTRDGHMSVEIMYPKAEASVSNDYVRDGYEASFGRYDVDEATHTVTHHVEGSITPGLVGKNLPRVYQFSDGHLIIRSSRPDEHWSVTWEHYQRAGGID